jgi:hypothetical protein
MPHIRQRGEELIKLRYSVRKWVVERTNHGIIGLGNYW